MPSHWKDIVLDKRARQAAAIPKEWLIQDLPPKEQLDVSGFPETCGLLTPEEIKITNSPVEVLLPAIASSQWTATQVTIAFYKRAVIAHQLTNCLTEIYVEKALAHAAELDQHLKATGNVVGPLHGLPVSLKDQINVKDTESTMGYISWIGIYASEDAVLVRILKDLGAVPFVKTNVPQTLMWPETYNKIFGRTTNPFNRSLTSGGSSGGEGALVALKGSPLGVGSDIGGSVRIPSSFCGVYGLRPSMGRIPYAGCVNSLNGQDSILSVLGPIASSLAGIKLFVEAIASQKPWIKDPLAVRKPWNEDEYKLIDHGNGQEPLCFAILWDDGKIVPHPPVLRALEVTKKALLSAGHHVVDWVPLKHTEIYECAGGIWAAAATEDFQAVTSLTNEPLVTSMAPEHEDLDELESKPFLHRYGSDTVSAFELFQIQKKRRDLREEYLRHWEDTVSITGTGRPVDALISPTAPYAAPPHGTNKYADYTLVWNVLDYTATVVPVTRVSQTLDAKRSRETFYCDADRENYEFYDPVKFANAPVSLQVVGRTLEEEAVIAISEIVDAALKETAVA